VYQQASSSDGKVLAAVTSTVCCCSYSFPAFTTYDLALSWVKKVYKHLYEVGMFAPDVPRGR